MARRHIHLAPETDAWVQRMINQHAFSGFSHAVNRGMTILRYLHETDALPRISRLIDKTPIPFHGDDPT